MRIIILILCFCLISSGRNLIGQNLVPNPSFENVSQYPPSGLLQYMNNWFEQCYPYSRVWLLSKYNANSPYSLYATPKSILGFQYPHTGDNHIRIATYSKSSTRFYPQVKLKKSLYKKNIILDCIYLCRIIQALRYQI